MRPGRCTGDAVASHCGAPAVHAYSPEQADNSTEPSAYNRCESFQRWINTNRQCVRNALRAIGTHKDTRLRFEDDLKLVLVDILSGTENATNHRIILDIRRHAEYYQQLRDVLYGEQRKIRAQLRCDKLRKLDNVYKNLSDNLP